ncbi:hypothetical protein GCM10016455_05740 [Aliiroseovarius zhejiangensis]|uniref:Uncharacterized protein n=1 Tax=Aliiroseovarius zhejiangensis TaxID=1632025 RepID=A0ABQ3IMC4_9RHOB|nr:hypothetical protein [Aliiroseovarius zhejiangensis]GHE88461.1 hypothetical protein GCM10016455_05740 [Aliiroseovarius zhejiangensis]
MSDIHANPETHGQRFGDVLVTVDVAAGDCVIHAPMTRRGAATQVAKRLHLHGLDEITGAYAVQFQRGATDCVAADIARALKFAGQSIQRGKSK